MFRNRFSDAMNDDLNTPQALDFITGGPRMNTANNDQRVITANITGELFELPGGWISERVARPGEGLQMRTNLPAAQ